jgi:hypothetical protein
MLRKINTSESDRRQETNEGGQTTQTIEIGASTERKRGSAGGGWRAANVGRLLPFLCLPPSLWSAASSPIKRSTFQAGTALWFQAPFTPPLPFPCEAVVADAFRKLGRKQRE